MFKEKCIDLTHLVVNEHEETFVNNEYRTNRMKERVDDRVSKVSIQSYESICHKTIHYARRFQLTFIS